jgi:hypothetical protein
VPNNVALDECGTPEAQRRPLPDYFLELSDDDPDPLDEEPDPFESDPPDDSLAAVFSGFGLPSDFFSPDAALLFALPALSARESVR